MLAAANIAGSFELLLLLLLLRLPLLEVAAVVCGEVCGCVEGVEFADAPGRRQGSDLVG